MKIAANFSEALDEIEQRKGIDKELIIESLKDAIKKAYIKYLNCGDDVNARVDIDVANGEINLFQIKKIVATDDDINDDLLEISLAEAKKESKKRGLKVDDDYEIPVSLDDLQKKNILSIKSIFLQKISEIEKSILYEVYKDKIGEMITGIVEKTDPISTLVNIGRTTVVLPKNQRIGQETFDLGQTIKLYVMDVVSTPKHGAQIAVSRACEGFLKRLFEEEIHEIYDGTVEIKAIAREAGERSKVAVYASDPNVDPTGACIGQNGTRIQKIVGQLGSGSVKEKIDIITYSDNPALFIAESLKPAQIVGISLNEDLKSAVAVVNDDSFTLAIGRRGANVRLAVRLTGWKIDIKDEKTAREEGISYTPLDAIKKENENSRREKEYETYLNSLKTSNKQSVSISKEDIKTEEAVNEELKETPVVEEEVTISETPIVEEKVAAPTKEKKEEVVETRKVKTTKTLEDLEKELSSAKKKEDKISKPKKTYRKANDEEEVAVESVSKKPVETDPSKYMQIYTDEELAEMEKEAQEYEDLKNNDEVEEDVDYDEYDTYYDDEN